MGHLGCKKGATVPGQRSECNRGIGKSTSRPAGHPQEMQRTAGTFKPPGGNGAVSLRRLVLVQAKGVAIAGYIPVVLFEAAGKAVVPATIADKVKKIRAVGVQSRLQ
jgi:hypothetical protein